MSIIFIGVLIVLLVIQHIWHQSVLNDKRFEHNESLDRIYDVLANEWIKGNVPSNSYHTVVEVVEKEHKYV